MKTVKNILLSLILGCGILQPVLQVANSPENPQPTTAREEEKAKQEQRREKIAKLTELVKQDQRREQIKKYVSWGASMAVCSGLPIAYGTYLAMTSTKTIMRGLGAGMICFGGAASVAIPIMIFIASIRIPL
jgi:hypothetical protein